MRYSTPSYRTIDMNVELLYCGTNKEEALVCFFTNEVDDSAFKWIENEPHNETQLHTIYDYELQNYEIYFDDPYDLNPIQSLISTIETELDVRAQRLIGERGHAMYSFSNFKIHARGNMIESVDKIVNDPEDNEDFDEGF